MINDQSTEYLNARRKLFRDRVGGTGLGAVSTHINVTVEGLVSREFGDLLVTVFRLRVNHLPQ
jgi:hypothetical protein